MSQRRNRTRITYGFIEFSQLVLPNVYLVKYENKYLQSPDDVMTAKTKKEHVVDQFEKRQLKVFVSEQSQCLVEINDDDEQYKAFKEVYFENSSMLCFGDPVLERRSREFHNLCFQYC
jgi:hypothetical protein